MPPPIRSQSAWVGKLIAEYGSALHAFFRRRTRVQHDAQDLAQEVYLRLLRVSDIDAVRNPEAYMFTIADNLLKERAVLARRRGRSIDLTESLEEELALPHAAVEHDVDSDLRAKRLSEVFAELSPKCRAAVVLQYRDERSYAEIAAQLGVSTNMVKKYLAYAVAHCRRRMRSWG
jgi:RNA polymerase sigma-70 factor (ECF subfamily)